MNKVKTLALTLMLGLAGAVYAAGGNGQSAPQSCHMDMAGASCCAKDAHCCDGGACCKADKSAHHATAQTGDEGASCCQSGCSCCAAHKAGDKQTAQQAGMTHKDGESCCVSGASCCNGGSCCTAHKQ
ncbi:MAG: hypothetical protein ACJ74W_14965 [Pyrinomonadaceae bacterium]